MIEIPQNSIDVIERIISENEHFVLFSHKNPDGDALGSSLALSHYLKSRGKNAVVVLPNLFPDFLAWLPGADDVILYENNPEKANDIRKNSSPYDHPDIENIRVDLCEFPRSYAGWKAHSGLGITCG